jgi:hypothetical protein
MRKLLLILLLVWLGSNTAPAQWVQTNGPYGGFVYSFAVSGTNLFAGTFGGVFLSTNNGTSWTAVNNGLTNTWVNALAVSGTNLFAGTNGGGVFLSTNNGTSWTSVNTGLTNPYVNALAVSPAAGGTGGTYLFAGTIGGGVFLSTDNGTSWTAVNNGLTGTGVLSLAISGTNLFAGTNGGGVFLSTNNGTSWTAVNTGLANVSVYALVISGTNLFAGTSGGVFLSTNNGTSWTAVNSGLADYISVYALAVSGTNLFAGTYGGGVFLSTNNGTSWTAVNNGLTSTSVLSLAISGTNLFAGTSGGGVWRRPLAQMITGEIFYTESDTKKNETEKEVIRKDVSPPTVTITEPQVTRGMKTAAKSILVKGRASDESGVYEVTVNDSEAKLSATGEFWAEVRLAVGENRIRVTATDTKGNTTEQILTIVREAETAPPPLAPLNALDIGEYHALVIAVNEYEDTRIRQLTNPVRDAENLISVLTRKYGFRSSNIRFLRNPTRAEIIAAFTVLQRTLRGNENVLVFYAGHGYWNDAIKQGYWLPRDARRDNPANWISNADVRDQIRGLKSKHTLLISDACFSGGIFRTRSAFSSAPAAIQEMYRLPSRKAMTSGTLTEVPDESVFLKYLIKRLEENTNPYLTAQELFVSFRTAVINNSRNVPQFGEIQDAGDEGGDFVFWRR